MVPVTFSVIQNLHDCVPRRPNGLREPCFVLRIAPQRFQAFPINEFGHMAVLRTAVICSSPVRQPPANWLTRDTCDRSSGYHRLRARVYAHNRATCHIRHIG